MMFLYATQPQSTYDTIVWFGWGLALGAFLLGGHRCDDSLEPTMKIVCLE